MSKKPTGMYGVVVAGRTMAMRCRGTRGEGCSHSWLCAGLGKGQVEWDSTSTWHQAAGGLATPANRGQQIFITFKQECSILESMYVVGAISVIVSSLIRFPEYILLLR